MQARLLFAAPVVLVIASWASAQQFIAAPTLPAGTSGGAALSADFNGDGNPDLALVSGINSSVLLSIQLGNGDGSFTQGQQITGADQGTAIVTGDWNGDGIPDLASAEEFAESVDIFLGVGDGTFISWPDREKRVKYLEFLVTYAHFKYGVVQSFGVVTDAGVSGRAYDFMLTRKQLTPELIGFLTTSADPFESSNEQL